MRIYILTHLRYQMWNEYDRQNPQTWPEVGQQVIIRCYNPYWGYPEYQVATFLMDNGPFWSIAERPRTTNPSSSHITHWKILETKEMNNE